MLNVLQYENGDINKTFQRSDMVASSVEFEMKWANLSNLAENTTMS